MGGVEAGGVLAGRYRLRAVVRRDGTGVVWLASDALRHEEVVLRAMPWVPPADDGGREPWRERAVREARALVRLDHPNVIGVIDMFEQDGRPWMVFDAAPYRFPYRTLSDLVRDDGPLRPAQAAGVGRHVLAAIRQAHAVGVLHRDVKPGSILLGPGNRVVLTDFGMVTADGSPTLTTPEPLIGSPRYMAPERARGEPATPAADLWSLGGTLYAMVEGRPPFDGDGTVAVVTAVLEGHPDPPARAGPLWPVISGLLRKDPRARPDAADVDWLLRRVAAPRAPAPMAAAPVAAPASAAPLPAGAAAAPGSSDAKARPDGPSSPGPVTPQQPGHGPDARTAADFVPGFGSPHPAPAAAGEPPDPGPAVAEPPDPVPAEAELPADAPAAAVPPARAPRRQWWVPSVTGGAVAVAAIVAIGMALWPAAHGLPALRSAVPGQVIAAAAVPLTRPGRWSAGPVPNAARARRGVTPGAAAPPPVRPAARIPSGAGSGSLPAGFTRYRDPTGFSIGVPDHWQVSHQGHLVYIQDPGSDRFLIVDQTRHPKPSPLADWREQEAARIGSYPGYHRIRLQAVRYTQAERAADWEFTYYDNGRLTHVLNRNILANARHAYALYWSTPASAWRASFHYFRAFASTFRPAPASR